MSSGSGFVTVLVIHLHFPDAGSLKAKRKELSSIKAGLQTRLGVSVAETAHHGLWQRAKLTAAVTARSATAAAEAGDRVERWLDARWPDGVRVQRALASVDELLDVAPAPGAEG